MCPKPDRNTKDENDESCIREAADLEGSLKKAQLDENYLNQLKYARADLENLQKNTDRRINEGVAREKERLILKILPVAEELDLAIKEARKTANIDIMEGIEMVKRKLWGILEGEGLRSIEAVGESFDPHFHEAIFEIETSDYPEGMVIEEIGKGYLINEKLLKPSMVKVAAKSDFITEKRKEK